MFIQALVIINKLVRSFRPEENLGVVADIIVDPKNGEILAFLLVPSPLRKSKIVPSDEIIDITPQAIIAKGLNSVVEINEVVRVKEIIDEKIKILGNHVITQKGKKLGKVDDFLIESQTAKLAKLYVKGNILAEFFQPNRVIPYKNIIKITAKAIVVREDIGPEKIAQKEEVEETVGATG